MARKQVHFSLVLDDYSFVAEQTRLEDVTIAGYFRSRVHEHRRELQRERCARESVVTQAQAERTMASVPRERSRFCSNRPTV
jgi:hypothetical protein